MKTEIEKIKTASESRSQFNELLACPFCGDKMKRTRSIINVDNRDAVTHIENNNNCPVGRGIYRFRMWQQRAN